MKCSNTLNILKLSDSGFASWVVGVVSARKSFIGITLEQESAVDSA